MPDDDVTAAQISAAGQVMASGLNYASSASANRKGRKWAEKMYERERSDALADWAMQNEYNSPAANMARLKAAGLNPNLVYGDGANMPSVNIRGADQSWKPEAPQFDAKGAADSILAIAGQKQTEAQTDNLKAQRLLIDQQILKTAAETQATGVSTETSAFNLEQIKQKASTDIAQVKANLQQTYANTEYTKDQNERSAAINSMHIAEAVQKIANMRVDQMLTKHNIGKTDQEIAASKQNVEHVKQQISNLQMDNDLKAIDKTLKENGIQPHDPAWQRTINTILKNMPEWDKAGDLKRWQNFKKTLRKIFPNP